MEELFGGKKIDNVLPVVGEEGPTITQEEVESAIHRLKNNKVPGPDRVHGEVLKLLDPEQIKLLTKLFNKGRTGIGEVEFTSWALDCAGNLTCKVDHTY
ncbi:hypothetical protein WA026_012482 [Henosepilachna vigintioctopunctata]|uniref:Uncharacterized protein n=1 Tax=Henosepilachna vigintioctopunctata TaxID=420089 RepID=A0AAW1UTB5_9CUCU